MSFAGQTARCPFEKVPPHFKQVLLRSIFRVGSFLTLKWLWGLCTDDPLDLKLFVNIEWFKIPFSPIWATLSVFHGVRVSVRSFRCISEFFKLIMKISLIHSSSPAVMSNF